MPTRGLATLVQPLPLPVRHNAIEQLLLGAGVVEVVVDDVVAERTRARSSRPRARRSPRAASTGTARHPRRTRSLRAAGGSSSSFSIPCSPAAIVAANARYGFTSPPGMRDSTRIAEPDPTMRKPHVRLSCPQASVVGAHEPGREPLVRVDVRRVEDRQLARARDLPGEVLLEGVALAVERALVAAPQRRVDVARRADPRVIGLRHERDRAPVQVRDLLRAVLVDDVVVGHRQRRRRSGS